LPAWLSNGLTEVSSPDGLTIGGECGIRSRKKSPFFVQLLGQDWADLFEPTKKKERKYSKAMRNRLRLPKKKRMRSGQDDGPQPK